MISSVKQSIWQTVQPWVQPSPRLEGEVPRRAALTLAGLALVMGIIFLLLTLLSMLDPLHSFNRFISLGGLLCAALVYTLSRTRFYAAGVILLIVSLVPGVIVTEITYQQPYLAIILIPVIFMTSRFGQQTVTGLLTLVTIGLLMFSAVYSSPQAENLVVHLALIGITGVMIVIAVRLSHQAEQRLREQMVTARHREARLREVTEGSQDAFYLLESVRDPADQVIDFEFVEANERGAVLFGLGRQQLIGKRLRHLMPREQFEYYFSRYSRVLETRQVLQGEFAITGEISPTPGVWVQQQIVPVSDGVAIISMDITPRKQAELALTESEARNRALIQALPDLLVVVNRDGLIGDYHAPLPFITAGLPLRLTGQTINDPEAAFLPILTDSLSETFTTRQTQIFEYDPLLPQGRRNFEGRLVAYDREHALLIIRDITEQVRASQQVVEAQVERERIALLSNFIRMASHEFRTPLSVINSSAYLMAKSDDPQHRMARSRIIEEHVLQLTRLIEDLVTMSRLDSGIAFELDTTNLTRLLIQIINQAQDALEVRQQQLIVDLPPEPVLIPHNGRLLLLALANILDNARKFTPDGGMIELRLQHGRHPATGAAAALIVVRDYGIGMPAEILEHVFERFYRGDMSQSTRGFGLGLSIARKIIELHQGRIDIVSEAGKGTTVTVTLPQPESTLVNRPPTPVRERKIETRPLPPLPPDVISGATSLAQD